MDSSRKRIKNIISKIDLKLRKKSGDFFWGSHKSIFKGQGMNFKNLRQYQYGDDVRNIDWKVTARSGKPHVKEFEQESEMQVNIVFDTSSSMFFGHEEYFKLYKAFDVVNIISQILIDNEDKFGLIYHDGDDVKVFKPSKGEKNLKVILQQLSNIDLDMGRKIDISVTLDTVLKLSRKRGGVVIISDFLYEMMYPDKFKDYLIKLGVKNDIFLVQILDPFEVELSNISDSYFYDLEKNKQTRIQINESRRKEYENEIREQIDDFHLMAKNLGIRSTLLFDNQDTISGLLDIFDLKKNITL